MAKRKVTTASKAKPVKPAPVLDPPVAVPAGAPSPEPPPPSVVGSQAPIVGSADPLPSPGEVWVPLPSKARKG